MFNRNMGRFEPAKVVGGTKDYLVFEDKDGRRFEKLTIGGRARKYCGELHTGKLLNLRGDPTDISLTDRQKSYRAGYLNARKDSSRVWKSKQKKSMGR